MRGRSNMAKLAGGAVIALLVAAFSAHQAAAQKEQFIRSKPHVNVSGSRQQSGDLTSESGNAPDAADNADCPTDATKRENASAADCHAEPRFVPDD